MKELFLLSALAAQPAFFSNETHVKDYRLLVEFLGRYPGIYLVLPYDHPIGSPRFERLPFTWRGMAIFHLKEAA